MVIKATYFLLHSQNGLLSFADFDRAFNNTYSRIRVNFQRAADRWKEGAFVRV